MTCAYSEEFGRWYEAGFNACTIEHHDETSSFSFAIEAFHSCTSSTIKSVEISFDALSEEEDVQKCLGGRRATGNVEIDGNDSVATSNYRVRVMVVTSSVRARSHGDDPSRLGHLIVDY